MKLKSECIKQIISHKNKFADANAKLKSDSSKMCVSIEPGRPGWSEQRIITIEGHPSTALLKML